MYLVFLVIFNFDLFIYLKILNIFNTYGERRKDLKET